MAAHTLCCKVNQCDTEAILARLGSIGGTQRDFAQGADICIINTCTVTHGSDKKSRQMIRRARAINPQGLVAVCGCMAKNDPTTPQSLGVDFIFDARNPEDFIAQVAGLFPHTGQGVAPKGQRTRAFVKIQDGCDRFCAYCIVPHVRGKPISRPTHDILTEVQGHIAHGVQEIVLTGIQVASYGEDTNDTTLGNLIQAIAQVNGLMRLRLSSIEPNAFTPEFIRQVSSCDILCPHFHISLQSGCDATLKRMNRHYTTRAYAHILESIGGPHMAFTTDIIVGFPGETDQEFEETLAFVKRMGFARIHVFEYSPRAGTPAATFPNQVPDKIKTARSQKMRDLGKALQTEFFAAQVGKTLPVLFESKNKDGQWQGYTSHYSPVTVASDRDLANTLVDIHIIGHHHDALAGQFPNIQS